MSRSDGANPAQTSHESTAAPTRSELLRAALEYAENGIPVFPLMPGSKKPLVKDWPNKATKDPQKITAWWNRWPEANIGVPTGERSGWLVVDQDHPATLDALEAEHGELPATRTHGTGSGGLHFLFRYPEGAKIRNSAGKLGDSLDVRGEGGYVVVPPSRTTRPYELLDAVNLAEAPSWLLEALRNTKPTGGTSKPKGEWRGGAKTPIRIEGGPIPFGRRNVELASIAGGLNDGTRTLAQLAADLEGINQNQCVPPIGDHPTDRDPNEVEKIARSIHGTEPCHPSRHREADPEVEALLDALSDRWYAEYLPKSGRSKKPDTLRACLRSAARRSEARTVVVNRQEERVAVFSESTRQLAEVVGTTAMSISNHLRELAKEGVLVVLEKRPGKAPTLGLLPGSAITLHPGPTPAGSQEEEVVEGVKKRRGPRADGLTTPYYGWRSPWRDCGVEAAVEAFGPQGMGELADMFGISRARDMRRRRLVPLEEMGVLVEDEGAWAVPEDHAGAVEERMREPYTTVTRRRRRKTTDEGRTVTWVEETVTTASEIERAAARAAYHAREREEFLKMRQAKLHRLAVECFGGVDPETGEILAERRDAPETVEEAAVAPAEVPVVPGVFGDAGDALEGHEEGGDLSELAMALGRYLDLNPGRSNESPSWLGIALWAEGYTNGKPPEIGVAAVLGELSRRGRWEAA